MEFTPLAIRWHGRGGQGAKTAASLLAELVIDYGGYAQAAPEFGPERRGAPVQAFTRISPAPIGRRGPIEEPDVVVVLDRRLLAASSTMSGVKPGTALVVNAAAGVVVPGLDPGRSISVDASGIARRTVGRDIPNVSMLAAVAALFTPLEPESVLDWLRGRLAREFRDDLVAGNVEAAQAAIREVRHERSVAVATA